jgi:hypothetical protein
MASSLLIAIPFIPAMVVLILIQQEELRSKIGLASASELSNPSAAFDLLGDGTPDAPSKN